MARPQSPSVAIRRWSEGGWTPADDQVAAEEPLQLLLGGDPLSIVMRTPGNDLELALGLLWAERVITDLSQVERVRISAEAGENSEALPVEAVLVESNQVDVQLTASAGRRPERSFLSSSACGVCGATTVESLALDFAVLPPGPELDPAGMPALADRLREGQALFERTGGLHAAGLFDLAGNLQLLREDVGRHNAVDKVVGRSLLDGRLPLHRSVLAVSGRAGYELVQKAVAAGIPFLVAVGAPSSLAVQVARAFNLTLAGFLKRDRFNVYSGGERLSSPARISAT
ncbi:MAG: formate dehydrogenase accessory sulfurtransferase FdhD [Chloroflexi bacterium]|nr:MAG: formate dehydrogenase accessory sulfurtransferase FdhD [Chloroflexota bacterium]TMD50825.1 MAG: formate dehydrogenase accessory sulfurtransferase FdhD [Chloroflexota bacterium]